MSDPDSLPEPPRVAGRSLSGDTPYVIDAAENARLCASTGVAPAADGSAHPIYFFIATQIGMGLTVAGLCEACEFDVADGPMMASSKTSFAGTLRTGVPYRVRGEILGLARKRSRKLGVMDMLDYRLDLVDESGTLVASTTNLWVLPRRNLT